MRWGKILKSSWSTLLPNDQTSEYWFWQVGWAKHFSLSISIKFQSKIQIGKKCMNFIQITFLAVNSKLFLIGWEVLMNNDYKYRFTVIYRGSKNFKLRTWSFFLWYHIWTFTDNKSLCCKKLAGIYFKETFLLRKK